MKNLIRQTTGSVRIFYAGYLYPIQYPGKSQHPSIPNFAWYSQSFTLL